MPRHNTIEDLWDHIEKTPHGCWLWKGKLTWNGYGSFRYQNKYHRVHRFVWELIRGPIPEGLLVLHKNDCHNRACCNPDHLYLGTHKDNVRDGIELGTMQIPPILTDERKQKISDTLKGRKIPAEARANMAEALRNRDPKVYEQIAAKNRGRKRTPEQRKRIAEGVKKGWEKRKKNYA